MKCFHCDLAKFRFDTTNTISTAIPKCKKCGVNQAFPELNECPIYQQGVWNKLYKCKQWEKVSITNTTNHQDELVEREFTIHQLLSNLRNKLDAARLHYVDTEWFRWRLRRHVLMSDPKFIRRVICTDFSATANLTSLKKTNSAVDTHAIIAVFFVYHNFRTVKILEEFTTEEMCNDITDTDELVLDGMNYKDAWVVVQEEMILENEDPWILINVDDFVICDCDVRQYIGGTESKGKSNDHHYHHACLDDLNSEFDSKLEDHMKCAVDELEKMEIWKKEVNVETMMS